MHPQEFSYFIFDLDGTLLDSMPMWKALDHEYLAQKNIPCTQEILDALHDMFLEECPPYFRSIGVKGTDEEIYAELNALSQFHYETDILPKPGVIKFLRGLKERGAHLCVATASPRPMVEAALKRLGLWDCMDFLAICAEVGKGKSDPEIFYTCAKRWGVTAQEILVFEDALYAARTAKSAGFPVVAIQDDSVNDVDAEILQTLCDRYIRSFTELL